MVKVLEYQRCKTELGIEKSTSIKSLDMLEVISGITDLMPLNNGSSISSTVELENSSFKDILLITDSESGSDSPGCHSLSISLDPFLVKENTITTPMITSTSLIERGQHDERHAPNLNKAFKSLSIQYQYHTCQIRYKI